MPCLGTGTLRCNEEPLKVDEGGHYPFGKTLLARLEWRDGGKESSYKALSKIQKKCSPDRKIVLRIERKQQIGEL